MSVDLLPLRTTADGTQMITDDVPLLSLFRLMDQVPVNKNTGASKMDPVSNNSTKFKEDLAFPSSSNVVEIASPSPGITNRKVKLKKNCSSEEINNDNWMVGLTDEQIATILESEGTRLLEKMSILFIVRVLNHIACTVYCTDSTVQKTIQMRRWFSQSLKST